MESAPPACRDRTEPCSLPSLGDAGSRHFTEYVRAQLSQLGGVLKSGALRLLTADFSSRTQGLIIVAIAAVVVIIKDAQATGLRVDLDLILLAIF